MTSSLNLNMQEGPEIGLTLNLISTSEEDNGILEPKEARDENSLYYYEILKRGDLLERVEEENSNEAGSDLSGVNVVKITRIFTKVIDTGCIPGRPDQEEEGEEEGGNRAGLESEVEVMSLEEFARKNEEIARKLFQLVKRDSAGLNHKVGFEEVVALGGNSACIYKVGTGEMSYEGPSSLANVLNLEDSLLPDYRTKEVLRKAIEFYKKAANFYEMAGDFAKAQKCKKRQIKCLYKELLLYISDSWQIIPPEEYNEELKRLENEIATCFDELDGLNEQRSEEGVDVGEAFVLNDDESELDNDRLKFSLSILELKEKIYVAFHKFFL